MAWTAPKTWSVGEKLTAAHMNTYVRDNLNTVRWRGVRKSADESVTSSTTLQNDDELLMAILASEVWTFDFHLFLAASTAGDFKAAITVPSGATLIAGGFGLDSAATTNIGNLTTFYTPTSGSLALTTGGGGAASTCARLSGTVLNSTNAGNIQLQWAQGTSDGTATTVKAGSFGVFHRISL